MGWLRLVGSTKLQVSFAEYSLFYRALLQKRPIILSILQSEATPYLYRYVEVFLCVCHIDHYVYVMEMRTMCSDFWVCLRTCPRTETMATGRSLLPVRR